MPTQPSITDDDFASAMQQLSAEAEHRLPPGKRTPDENAAAAANLQPVLDGLAALGRRLAAIETQVAAPPAPAADWKPQFQKLDEQLAAIRSSETVNQRLFDSLHQELLGYRDNFLLESLQKPFIRDLLVLFDDLTGVAAQLNATALAEGSRSPVAHARENLDNTLHFLLEILHRLEVNEMEPTDTVNLERHRVISYEPADFAEDDERIVVRLKRGFMWRDRVLRAEEVIAKRFE